MHNSSNKPREMQLLENLKWRYATKKYDATKKVSEEHLQIIKEAVQLSASSFGLQPYKILDIRDKDLREKLKPLSWGQSQITDASHLFVFCNYTVVDEKFVDDCILQKAKTNSAKPKDFVGYGDYVKSKLKEKSPEEINHWTARQTYIALGNALNACSELKLDSTPIEGFEPDAYNEILGLENQKLTACVLLAIGYRHTEDSNQHVKKSRRGLNELFEVV